MTCPQSAETLQGQGRPAAPCCALAESTHACTQALVLSAPTDGIQRAPAQATAALRLTLPLGSLSSLLAGTDSPPAETAIKQVGTKYFSQ
jgi:hypothetical protein